MVMMVVEPLGSAVLRWLESRHTVRFRPELTENPAALRHALAGVQALILPAAVTVDAELLSHAPQLRAIGRVSGGVESIDDDACRAAGVTVVRSATAADAAEAEFVIGALLALLRRVPVMDADGLAVGRELGAATVGLLGFPHGLPQLIRRLEAFGSTVIGYDPTVRAGDARVERLSIRSVGLQELFAEADAVCVQLAFFSRYRGLVGDTLLRHARSDQVIVSTTHSAIFDDAALARALNRGPLAAAWLDSVEPGLLEAGRPLHGVSRLQVTPRVAATTRESRLRSAWDVVRRIDALLATSGPGSATQPA